MENKNKNLMIAWGSIILAFIIVYVYLTNFTDPSNPLSYIINMPIHVVIFIMVIILLWILKPWKHKNIFLRTITSMLSPVVLIAIFLPGGSLLGTVLFFVALGPTIIIFLIAGIVSSIYFKKAQNLEVTEGLENKLA